MNDFDKEVEKNLPLVSYILQKYYHKWNEDMFQTGCVGLVKAVKTFDLSKNVAKSTYYTKCIKNEIDSINRRNNMKKRNGTTVSLNIGIADNLELQDILADTINVEEDLIKNETLGLLYELIKDLSSRDKIIITLSFGLFNYDKKTQEEIAKIIGVNQASVSRRVKRILIRLRGKIENESNNRRL